MTVIAAVGSKVYGRQGAAGICPEERSMAEFEGEIISEAVAPADSAGATTAGSTPPQDAGRGSYEVHKEAARAETVAPRDALDRTRFAEVLAEMLADRKDKHPIALALWGAWGSGKSSLVEFLKSALRANTKAGFRFAEFNAWKNEGVENLGAALAQAVVEALVRDLGFWQQTALALKLARRRDERVRRTVAKDASRASTWRYSTWKWTATYFVPFLAPALLGLMALGLFLAGKPIWGSLGTFGTGVVAWFSVQSVRSKELLGWFKEFLKDHKSAFRLPDYAEKIGSFHEMSQTLEDLCSLTLVRSDVASSEKYLLVIVDDLDRCSPAAIKQVFDAVRLVASITHVVVLVALDHRIAYAAVTRHYSEYGTADRELGQLARDYLAKVFNLSVSLNAADSPSIRNYVEHHLFDLPEGGVKPGRPAVHLGESLGKSTPVEAEAFADLAITLKLTNPRELWRLRQAWAVLKGIALSGRATDAEVRDWLRHLFVREAVLQGTAQQRKLAEHFFESGNEPDRAALWSAELTQAAAAILPGFSGRDEFVRAVLLPAAPFELAKP
jgi:hypothetical protein